MVKTKLEKLLKRAVRMQRMRLYRFSNWYCRRVLRKVKDLSGPDTLLPVQAHHIMGVNFTQMKKIAHAVRALREAQLQSMRLAAQLQEGKILSDQCKLYLGINLFDLALEKLQEAFELLPERTPERSSAYMFRGILDWKQGDRNHAHQMIQFAYTELSSMPGTDDVLSRRLNVLLRLAYISMVRGNRTIGAAQAREAMKLAIYLLDVKAFAAAVLLRFAASQFSNKTLLSDKMSDRMI